MSYSLPAVEEYEKILPAARLIYEHNNSLSWQMLLPLFLLSVVLGYTSDLGLGGSVLMRLKRLFLVALLLVSFPRIAEFSQVLGVEIAKSIDDMTGIDMVLDAASKKAEAYSFDLKTLLSLGGDLVMGVLVSASFAILIVARFFLLAFQHFYWFLLIALGPFLILGLLFESSAGMTKGLFKNLFQVASWPIIWSTMSAFLKVLPFASAYSTEGGMVTVVTLNLIIAVALLFSPFLVSQLCEGVNLSIGNTLRTGALNAIAMASGPKGAAVSVALRKAGTAGAAKAASFAQNSSRVIRSNANFRGGK